MRPREMGHAFGGSAKSASKRVVASSTEPEVVTTTVDQRVWKLQRAKAREVAINHLGITKKDLKKTSNEIRVANLMNMLLVVTRDGGVIVGNNPEHAQHLKFLDRNNFPIGHAED